MQQTDFDIIPNRESIASVERQIEFFPSASDSPKNLATEQIARWNRDGYLGPLDVYDREEIVDIREYFDGLLADALAAGGDSYSISSAHLKHARVWDMLTNPQIVGYVSDLLGENVIGWGSHFFCKLPGDGKSVDWHQDCSFWPLTPTKAVTVWLAIDDA
ncbi:MAG: phytanoyl-CoA dioxygenase family protein, partial [Rubripirellula sp.]